MARDRIRLARRLAELTTGKSRAGREGQDPWASLSDAVAVAEEAVAVRERAVPAITYPEELPVTQRHDDLVAALRDNQVVVVAGDTG